MNKNLVMFVVVLVGLACGVGGYAVGLRTAPTPWSQERETLYKQQWELAKEVRAMRETAAGYRAHEKPASRHSAAGRHTTRPGT